MKSFIIIAFVTALCVFVMSSMRIEIKEPGVYEVYYIKHIELDTLHPENRYFRETQMALRVGSTVSMFYPVQRLWNDSLMKTDFNKHLEIYYKINPIGSSDYKPLGSLESEYIFKNMPEGKNTVKDQFDFESYFYEEDISYPEWELMDSTKLVLGYECSLAKSDFHGRVWYAWYATEIPSNNGPWKLAGLPGLILEAYDSKCHYVFTANAMRDNNVSPVGIYMYCDDEQKLTRDEFLKRRYKYTTSGVNMGERLRASGAYGLQPQNEPTEEVKVVKRICDFEEMDYPHK